MARERDNLGGSPLIIFSDGFLGHVNGSEECVELHDALDLPFIADRLSDVNEAVLDAKLRWFRDENNGIESHWHNAPPLRVTTEWANGASTKVSNFLITRQRP